MWFEKIKRYYKLGIWNCAMVKNAVIKHKITEAECLQILSQRPL